VETILARPDIDCVSLCVPNHLHTELAAQALRAGKHVLCEVPMAPCLADSRALINAVETTHRVLQVAQIDRVDPVFMQIKRLVESGELGRPFLAESNFVSRGWTRAMPADWWGRDARNPQIVLVSVGCFPVSLLRWVMGPIVEVAAYGSRQGWPRQAHDDTVVVNLRFRSGALGRILISEAAQRPYALDLAVYGDEGTVVNNRLALNRLHELNSDRFTELPLPLIEWRAFPDPAIQARFDAEIAAFLASIAGGTPLVDVYEGAAIAATLDAVAQSIATGYPVAVPDLPKRAITAVA
jgi:predicted dehydrogenase